MPSNYKTENKQTVADEKTPLTFKAWKILKDSQNKTLAKTQNEKCFKHNSNQKNNFNAINDESNVYNYNSNYRNRFPIVQRSQNFCAGGIDVSGFMPSNNFRGVNNNNRSCFNRPNNFARLNDNNNFNRPNNFVDYMLSNNSNSYETRNLSDSSRLMNNFGKGGNSYDLPCSFFTSDGIYHQNSMIQKPLLNNNLFRKDSIVIQPLLEIDTSRFTKFEKRNTKEINKVTNGQTTNSGTRNIINEPKIYVPNPKAKIDGKPYIPKPKIPEQNFDISKEQKKKQWKEYRDAMKPFKNRDFYNAKRVIQRFGKKAAQDLDEKQIIRLTKAREFMTAHKARLAEKYSNYIKADDDCHELGELYILKKTSVSGSEFRKPENNQAQNYGS